MSEQFDRRMLLGAAGLAGVAALSKMAHAGDLNPPPGPISPTMKPLDQIEPRIAINSTTASGSTNAVHRILQPGSYYLTGDIVGEPGKSGIVVFSVAGEVVIDLNGFTIRGVGGSLIGISCNGPNPRVVIRNGQIRGWGRNGVSAVCPMVLEDLRIEACGEGLADHGGVRGGDAVAAQVRRCVFAGNNGDGLRVGEGSVVEQCVASENSGHGISTSSNCLISHCDSHLNMDTGVACADNCVLRCVTSTRNFLRGILVGDGSEVSGCIFSRNNDTGIQFGSSCHIHSNTCSYSQCIGYTTSGDFSVVHDNTSIQSGCREFEITGVRNIVVRNFSASNVQNYNLGSLGANIFGGVVGLSNIANSSNPHANYIAQ